MALTCKTAFYKRGENGRNRKYPKKSNIIIFIFILNNDFLLISSLVFFFLISLFLFLSVPSFLLLLIFLFFCSVRQLLPFSSLFQFFLRYAFLNRKRFIIIFYKNTRRFARRYL